MTDELSPHGTMFLTPAVVNRWSIELEAGGGITFITRDEDGNEESRHVLTAGQVARALRRLAEEVSDE